MWVRFLHLEVLKDAEDDEETDRASRALLDEGIDRPRSRRIRQLPAHRRRRPRSQTC